jgi:hypothetical protein
VSVVATYGLLLSLVISLFQPQGLIVTLGLVLLLLILNFDLYRFFYDKRGLAFSFRVIPLHWLYYFYNAISFGLGLLLHWQDQLWARVISSPGSFADGVDTDGH